MTMNRHKYFWLIVAMISILAILICTLPLVQNVDKTAQGVRFVNGESQDQVITITIAGLKRNYLFREDKLDVSLTISDFEADIQTLGQISPEHDGLYSSTIVYYNPIENIYDFGLLEFNKDFSILILKGINKNIYVASSKSNANLEEIFRTYSTSFAQWN